MTDKELKRMSRRELLELLVFQMEENEKLRKELEQANEKLKDRDIMISESGSMAEAALRINGVLQAVERAAQQYLHNVRRLEAESRQKAEAMKTETMKADVMKADATNKGNEVL